MPGSAGLEKSTMSRMRSSVLRAALLIVCGYAVVLSASAQERWEPPGTPLPDYARVYPVQPHGTRLPLFTNELPNIMVVGYWPPTNEMLRRFSPSATQNPDGWIGENWEGRGFNIYSFVPEVPHGLGEGEGDFRVDYQHTSTDFWYYTGQVQPVAIITFGRALVDNHWTIEIHHRNRGLNAWTNDYESPFQPTPSPPDNSVPVNTWRYSSLNMTEIRNAVAAAGLNVTPIVNTAGDAGNFLCEYIGYHACWYHDLHTPPTEPLNVAAGHIHVGSLVTLPDAIAATQVTLRTVERYLHRQLVVPGDMNCDGSIDVSDVDAFVLALSGQAAYQAVYPDCNRLNADCNGDGVIDFADIDAFVALLGG